jgi:septal ring factor EnvC (AmiA/AmiB activator)
MKFIKKYWLLIVAAIGAIFAAFVMFSSKRRETKLDKLQDQIQDNNEQIAEAEGRIEQIQEQREQVAEKIKQTETEIEDLKQQVTEIQPEERTVENAKQNILNKTRRGRKPKKS